MAAKAIELASYNKYVMNRVNGKFTEKGMRLVRSEMVISKAYAEQENANDNGVLFVLNDQAKGVKTKSKTKKAK